VDQESAVITKCTRSLPADSVSVLGFIFQWGSKCRSVRLKDLAWGKSHSRAQRLNDSISPNVVMPCVGHLTQAGPNGFVAVAKTTLLELHKPN